MTPMVCNPVTGEFITLPEMKATLQGQTTYFGSEKFSYIKIDDESTTGGACTLINYEGKLGGVEFTDIDRRNLRLWLVEQDHAGKYKWSSNIYELTLSLANFYIVGMTGASDIVLSPYHLLDPFYVFYYNVERKALTRVEIQGFQKFKRLRPRVYTFQDYLEDVKLSKHSSLLFSCSHPLPYAYLERSEKFSYIKIDDESTTGGACTLINYEGKLGGVEFTDIDRRNLRLWLVEQDHAGKYKWSSNIYELTLSLANFYIVGMTGASDIVLSPYHLLDPFYVFYYNVERKALTRVEIQGFQKFKRLRPRVYTFQDYLEDVKLMECL
ncbi:hypothetical protein F2Q70_00026866 [Brassica cretica]|uniref:F-box associated beta-propeller type 3 domain-containing protein n=1 Tax=Brassica cretica TaxID=69181 RepID=A0A8S9L969_BRACR|nr:hypothetical protein F2Q70_00026866 [Brassica cretica]